MPPVKPRRLTDSLPCVLPGTRTRLVPGFLFAPTKERAILNIYVDTCVLPRAHLEEARIYREQFGDQLGFELLAMFDLPDFEENLKKNLDFFSSVPLMFHEPVWGVEHTAPRGSAAWEDGMYHIRLAAKYAQILHPSMMVCHLNNCTVSLREQESMLRTALENLEEMRELFPGVELLLENTGVRTEGTMLLDQAEFTALCREKGFSVLIDTGHANTNRWDLAKLIGDLHTQIRGYHLHNNDGIHDLHNRLRNGTIRFPELVSCIDRLTPDAVRVIEYTAPKYHGEPLLEDIAYLRSLSGSGKTGGCHGE